MRRGHSNVLTMMRMWDESRYFPLFPTAGLRTMQLSPHFQLEEFLRSEVAARQGLEVKIEDPQILDHLKMWCLQVGEPLREKLGRPLVILSGYRPEWLNRMVGGAKDSEHLDGRAADIIVPGLTPLQVCTVVSCSLIPFNQCIHEFPPAGWCHVSVPAPGMAAKRQLLTATSVGGITEYRNGILAA